ncbi:MAG TPA: RNA methyltransferase [Polyangiaceae bacterium]|nr:RNA methyltransferase [Polyangiaceae bacterium]
MLSFPIHQQTKFILVQPHYPENVGAAARAIKTMGFSRLVLVKPGKMAVPEHVMARKMAVKSLDVLEASTVVKTLDAALEGVDVSFATTSRSGVSYIENPADAAADMLRFAAQGKQLAIVFGNEKSGLDKSQLERCSRFIRIAMAAEQPSINLAQTVQIIAYQLLATALATTETS